MDVDDEDLMDQVFMSFDLDNDFQLNLHEFSRAILGEEIGDTDKRKLLNKIRKQIDPDDMLQSFQDIDKNDDKSIDFKEFSDYFGNILTQKQLENLFQQCSKDGNMSYEQFTELVSEDHLDYKKIKHKIKEYINKKDMSEEDLFDKYRGKKDYLSHYDMEKMLNAVGFHFDRDMIEELFN